MAEHEKSRELLTEQSYFFSFDPGEGRWYVVTPGSGGLRALRVINDDDAAMIAEDLVMPFGDEVETSIN
jgi:hypothetical protein